MDGKWAVVLVYSTSHALRIEKMLGSAGIATKLIPVPRHLSSDCGVCVRIETANSIQVEELLQAWGVEYAELAPV